MTKGFSPVIKKVLILFVCFLTLASLASCSSSKVAACISGTTKVENNVVAFCAEVNGQTQFVSEGEDYSNLDLLVKLVAFNQKFYPEYVFDETPEKNNDLLNMLLQESDALNNDQLSRYVSGDPRWDLLIETFSRFKSAEASFRAADTVDVRKIYLDEKENLREEVRAKFEVLISDLMGKYGISTRESVLDFGVMIYKQST